MPGIVYLLMGIALLIISVTMSGPLSLLRRPLGGIYRHFKEETSANRLTRFGLDIAGLASSWLGLWLLWHGR